MNNGDKIRGMTDEELARHINCGFPRCNEICEDFKAGCSWGCTHRTGEYGIAGDLKILEWIKKEV